MSERIVASVTGDRFPWGGDITTESSRRDVCGGPFARAHPHDSHRVIPRALAELRSRDAHTPRSSPDCQLDAARPGGTGNRNRDPIATYDAE